MYQAGTVLELLYVKQVELLAGSTSHAHRGCPACLERVRDTPSSGVTHEHLCVSMARSQGIVIDGLNVARDKTHRLGSTRVA